MRRFAVTLLAIVGTCYAALLDSTYLPPGGGNGAGGSGLIQAPNRGGGGGRPGFGGGGAGGNGGGGGPRGPGGNGGRGGGGGGGGGEGQEIPILSFNNENNGDGSYQFNYETGNGISVQESGQQHGEAESVSGSFSYTGPDGAQYTITYTADEEGFHPEGAHLPTPPPIPPEIQRGVELSLAAEARGENQDTSSAGNGGASGGRGYSQGNGFGAGGGRGNGSGGGTGRGSSGGGGGGSAYQGPNSYQTSSNGGYRY